MIVAEAAETLPLPHQHPERSGQPQDPGRPEQPAPRSARRGRAANPDLLVGLALGAMSVYIASVGVVIVILAQDLGLRTADLAWMGSAFGVGLLAGAAVGPLVLRRGPQPALAVSTLMTGLGIALIALAPTLPLIAAGAVLQSLGGAGLVLVVPTLLTGPTAGARLTRVNAAASAVGVFAPLAIGGLIALGVNGRLALLAAVPPLLFVAAAAAREVLAGRDTSPEGTAAMADPSTSHRPHPPASTNPAPAVVRVHLPTLVSRWLAVTLSVAAEFAFIVWAVARLVDAGLATGFAATIGAAFPIGMSVGRVAGPWVMRRLPAVLLGAATAAAGTLIVVLGQSWPLIAAGLLLAGLGISILYPVTLARLMDTPNLAPSFGSSLGALASGVAITAAPAGLAVLGGVVELRFAFLAVLPLLVAVPVLFGSAARRVRSAR